MQQALLKTDLNLPNRRQGKVRDLYDVRLANGADALLIVATDRISAFDVVMANGLPGKGVVLTQISKFWFDHFADQVEHHLISTDPADVPGLSPSEREALAGRIMLCRKTEVVPIECIARGYITGSGWKDYQASGAVCGIPLPSGLRNSDRLEEPLFTPSTKADTGHDENISFAAGAEIVGEELMSWLSATTLSLYNKARAYALERGIILADTKFEFGRLPVGDTHPDRRDLYPGQQPLLARRPMAAGARAAQLRQADRAQLPGNRGGRRRMGQDPARPRPAGRSGGAQRRPLPGSLPAADRQGPLKHPDWRCRRNAAVWCDLGLGHLQEALPTARPLVALDAGADP